MLGEKGEGWRSFSRLVDARCDAAREEERPPSRLFWKRREGGWSKERGGAQGGAKGGAPRYKRDGRGGFAARLVGWSSRFCSCNVGFLLLVRCSCQSSFLLPFGPCASPGSRERARRKRRNTQSVSPKPRPCCRADHTSDARHELADHAGGARSFSRKGRTRHAQGSRDFHLFWVLCKCVCVAPVCKVELLKCSCAVNNCIIFGCSSALFLACVSLL